MSAFGRIIYQSGRDLSWIVSPASSPDYVISKQSAWLHCHSTLQLHGCLVHRPINDLNVLPLYSRPAEAITHDVLGTKMGPATFWLSTSSLYSLCTGQSGLHKQTNKSNLILTVCSLVERERATTAYMGFCWPVSCVSSQSKQRDASAPLVGVAESHWAP